MKDDKRKRILDAMERMMFQMPDKEISVNAIAKNAGISKGSVYYYFDSKDEILYAVVERCYKNAIQEYFNVIHSETKALEKIKLLFRCIIQQEFHDNQKNLIMALHLHEDMRLHNEMKTVAVQFLSPILAELLEQGVTEGSIQIDTPKESAEIIVAVLTFLLDSAEFPEGEDKSLLKKLQIFSRVMDICLHAEQGSFDFLWDISREKE